MNVRKQNELQRLYVLFKELEGNAAINEYGVFNNHGVALRACGDYVKVDLRHRLS